MYDRDMPFPIYVPVFRALGEGVAIGRIKASAGLVTDQGTVDSVSAETGLIKIGDREYYGEHLRVSEANANAKSWPNNSTDMVAGTHTRTDWVHTV